MIYFTGCTHLGHANIIKHCKRPFASVDKMDRVILENTLDVLKPGDRLYHLGDIAWNKRKLEEYRKALNYCYLTTLTGNHDECEKEFGMKYKGNVIEIEVDKQIIVLCHYPLLSWPKSCHGSIHLYSHSHGKLIHPSPRAVDVSVDAWNFKPVSLAQVLELIARKEGENLNG